MKPEKPLTELQIAILSMLNNCDAVQCEDHSWRPKTALDDNLKYFEIDMQALIDSGYAEIVREAPITIARITEHGRNFHRQRGNDRV